MRSSASRTFIFLAVLLIAAGSTSARHLEKRQTDSQNVNYYEKITNKLNELSSAPIVGPIMNPYITRAKNLLSTLDNATDGSLSSVVNSIMPCSFANNHIQCDGTLDKQGAQSLAKKLIDMIPESILPLSVASVLKMATSLI